MTGPDLRVTLKSLTVGQMLDTLPARLALTREQKMPHADFLQLILADEVTAARPSPRPCAPAAGLDPSMRVDTWDDAAAITYDRQLWNEMTPSSWQDPGCFTLAGLCRLLPRRACVGQGASACQG